MAISHIKSVTVPDFAGAITLYGSNGATTTANATDLVRPSDWNSQHYQLMTIAGNTAGASTLSGTNIILAGGNNLTLSANGSTLSFIGPSQNTTSGAGTGFTGVNATGTLNSNGLSISVGAGGGGNMTISAAGSSASSGSIVFSNSNNLSFGMNGNTVTGSASYPAQTAFVLSNSNGITFGTNASTVTASYNSTSAAGLGTTYAGANISGSMTMNTAGLNLSLSVPATSSLSVSGNASLVVNANTISIGANAAAVSIGGNSTSAGAGYSNVSTGTAVLMGGNNITLSQNGNSITISGPNAGGAQTGISSIVVSNATYTSGQVSFSNANGITFGSSAGQAITASYNSTQFAGTGTTFAGTNASASITLNSAGLNMALSAAAGGGGNATMSMYATSNTTGNASSISVDARSLTLQGAGIISVGYSTSAGGTSLIISGPGTATLPQMLAGFSTGGNTTGTTGLVTGQLVLAGGANITLSGSTNAGSMTVSIVGGAGGGIAAAAGTQTGTSGTIVFSNSNGITFGMSNSSVVTASYNSTQFAGTGTSATNASITMNSNGLAISVAAPGGGGGINIAASNTTFTSGTVVMSVQAGAMTISSGAQSVLFNVPQTSSLVGTNGISISVNGSTISVSPLSTGPFAGTGTTFAGANVSGSMTLNTNGLNLSLSAPTPGGGAAFTGSWWQPEVWGNTILNTFANGTMYMRPFELDAYYDSDRYLFIQSLVSSATTMSISASVSAGNASSGTGTWGKTGTVLLFTRQNTNETNASYNNIVSYDSKTFSMSAGYSNSVSWSTNASSATASWTTSAAIGWVQNIDGNGGFTTSSLGTSGSSTFSSTSTNANSFSSSYAMAFPYSYFSAIRPVWVAGSGSNVPPGEYWIGMIQSTNTGSTNYPLNRIAYMSDAGYLHFTGSSNNSYLEIGQSVNISSSNYRLGFGSYSSSGNTTTSIALSQVTSMASNASFYFALMGQTK